MKAPVETARPQLRIQCLRFLHHRHCHVHILTLPQDLVVKDESILVFDNGDRNPEFDRRARLAFGNPTRVFLENGKDLLLVRNRLATQKTPLHMVNLPPGVSDEACDGATAQFPTPWPRNTSSVASARSTSVRQRSTYAATRSGCRCARLVERTL